MLATYETMPDGRPDYLERQRARYESFRATALEGLGRKEEAAEAYEAFQQLQAGQTAEGKVLGCDYLFLAGKWQEAADNYSYLDELMQENKSTYSLENIQKMLLKKFDVNMKAGRIDTAQAVSMVITQHLDSAITERRRADAREQEAIHQKGKEMEAEREHAQQQRQMSRLVIMALLILALVIYILVRHRMQRRLKKAHDELKVAYDQLEETTTAKERMESELRIARDIQMSMVPSVFPAVDGLDMYASMTPAKEVGGDLYSYLQQGDRLYFCIGDVSGKGVPASLFMAQASRLFRTLASQGMKPAEIATRMNSELAEDNEQGMFVTMIICLLDLNSGRLEFCNAGHNPPVIANAQCAMPDAQFLEMIPNAPVGLWPELEYEGEVIENISNRLMLLYTDGLNEAENQRQEQYGEERIISLLATCNSCSTRDIVETIKTDVNAFRNGADPNDDLTMLALVLRKDT